jgi:hypothetical protein
MTEAADTEHGDKITSPCWRISQGVECGETRAQQWCGVGRRHAVGYRHESTRFCDYHFGISAVMMNAGIFLVPAVHEIAISTKLAISTGATEKPHPNALTDFPTLHAGTDSIDSPDDLMARDARPFDRKQTFHSTRIGMANAACLDANAHLTRTRIQKRPAYLRKLSRS